MGKTGNSNKKINAERINALRKTYESLMDDERRRKDRNEQIISILDKMRMSNTVALRTPFSRYYDDYRLGNVSPTSHLSDDLRRQKFSETNQPRPLVPAIINNINEEIILKEMSKKYIIIPKLRHANITLQCERAFDSTSPVTKSNFESDDWKRKYEILNQLKTSNETNDASPYVMEPERDEKTTEEVSPQNLKFKEESEYSTVAKLVADAKLKNTIENLALTNLANEFAELKTTDKEKFVENFEANGQINQEQPYKKEKNQDEVIYANVTTANLQPNITYDNVQCTEYRAPDNVAIDPQKPEPRTFDDQEEEVSEIETDLRYTREEIIPNNENIIPEIVLQYNENSNYAEDVEQYNEQAETDELVTYEAKPNENQNPEITLTETQNFAEIKNQNYQAKTNEQQNPTYQNYEAIENEYQNPTTLEYQNVNTEINDTQNFAEIPNQCYEAKTNEQQNPTYQNYEAISNEHQTATISEYQNVDTNESPNYQNSDVKNIEEPIYDGQPNVYENYNLTNQNMEAPESQYQNYNTQQHESVDYSNEYQVYNPEQSTAEQEQINEFNEENNTMFYAENTEEPIYQQPELQQLPEFDRNQYVFDTDNETMQPYDQNYEQQYSGLVYDTTQEVPIDTNQGDYGEANLTDYGIVENPAKLYVEQVEAELDTEDGLSIPPQMVT